MAKDVNICEKYDAKTIQQLYKIITNADKTGYENKNVFPVSLVQCIFDAFTGTRLDQILALCNSVYIPYAGSSEATRLKIGVDMRRKGLIITFRDLNNFTWTQRYKNENSIADEEWQKDDNWEAWDFDSLLKDISDIVENIFTDIDNYPDLKEYIDDSINNYIQEVLSNGDFAQMIRDILIEIVPNFILTAVQNYFEGDGRDLIRELIMELLPDALSDFLQDIHNALRDNERVTANALARHELAIQEIQTQLGIH